LAHRQNVYVPNPADYAEKVNSGNEFTSPVIPPHFEQNRQSGSDRNTVDPSAETALTDKR